MVDILSDAFNSNIFNVVTLSESVRRMAYMPQEIQNMGIFTEQPISTTSVMIEELNGTLGLVGTTRRGAPGNPLIDEKRTARSLALMHLCTQAQVKADDVLNLRAFGQTTATEMLATLVNDRLLQARRFLEVTQEFHRAGALQGKIYDSDGATVILNLFDSFGVTEQTVNIVLSSAGEDVHGKVIQINRAIRDGLGSQVFTGVNCLCGSEWFDAFLAHPNVKEVLKYYASGGMELRGDVRKGFLFGGINFIEYRSFVGSQFFIPAGEARAFPVGVPGMYLSVYGPADYVETVGTLGQPFYAKSEILPMGKAVQLEVQTNPLHLCMYPKSLIKVTKT